MNRPTLWALAALALAAAPAALAEGTEHIVTDGGSVYGGVSLEAFNARIESGAKETLAQYPQAGPRGVELDGAFPLDMAEYRVLGGQGVLLIGAIVRDPAELPVKRVYVLVDGREVELERIASFTRDVSKGSAAETAYGGYREDSFYLVPVEYLANSPQILCDFAANRTGFLLSSRPFDVPDFIAGIPDKSKGADPGATTLRAFLDREYPGMMGAP
jgi:hypothetical protein